MAAANQTGPIAVYGATGFTGKLVAQELRRREADFVIAGRGALLASDSSFDRSGALAPAQAFDLQAFLDALGDFGVVSEVEPLPEPAPAAR